MRNAKRATRAIERTIGSYILPVNFAVCYDTMRGLDVASVTPGLPHFFSFASPLRVPSYYRGRWLPLRGEAPGFISRSPRGDMCASDDGGAYVVNHVDDAKTEGERADAAVSSVARLIVNTCPHARRRRRCSRVRYQNINAMTRSTRR